MAFRSDAIVNGAQAGVCGGGFRADGGPCRCGCPEVCTTGNQCALYEAQTIAASQAAALSCAPPNDPAATIAAIRAIGFAGGIDGYTNLGSGFDATVTDSAIDELAISVTGEPTIDPPIDSELRDTLVWHVEYTVRVRFARASLTPAQLEDRFGPPQHPDGWQLWRVYATYADAANADPLACMGIWLDTGPATGRSTLTRIDTNSATTVFEDVVVDGFLDYISSNRVAIPGALGFNAERLVVHNPADDVVVQPNRFFAVLAYADGGGVPSDGLAYLPWRREIQPAVESFRDAFLPYPLGIEPYYPQSSLPPWVDDHDFCQALIERAQLERQGGAGRATFAESSPGFLEAEADHDASLAVTYGLSADLVSQNRATATETFVGAGYVAAYTSRVDRVASVAATPIPCPPPGPADSLPAIDCGTAPLDFRVALACLDGAPFVSFDPDAAPADAVTLEYDRGDGLRRYVLTEIPTAIMPVAGAEFGSEPCGGVRLGVACEGTGSTWPYRVADAFVGDEPALTFRALVPVPGDPDADPVSKIFAVSSTETDLVALPVDAWLLEPCLDTGFFEAERCGGGLPGDFPGVIRYAPDAGGPRAGHEVTLTRAADPRPGCFSFIRYRSTTRPADAGLPLGAFRSSLDACARGDSAVCLDDPTRPPPLSDFCEFCLQYTGDDELTLRLCGINCNRSRGTDGGGASGNPNRDAMDAAFARQMAGSVCFGCGDSMP